MARKLDQSVVFIYLGPWTTNYRSITTMLYQFGSDNTRKFESWYKTYISLFLGQNGYYINQYKPQKATITSPSLPTLNRQKLMGDLLFNSGKRYTAVMDAQDKQTIKIYQKQQIAILKKLKDDLVPILNGLPFYSKISVTALNELGIYIRNLEKIISI